MNNRYRNVPGLSGPTKASAATLCQKCLKRDIYECTVSAQERPYISRPSRTQQLQNPKLIPKLSSDTPNDRTRQEGVADQLLAEREEERGRKRELDEPESYPSKRPRSLSSHSNSSVSTISTRSSRSPSHRPSSSRGRSSHRLTPKKRQYSDSSSNSSTPSYSSSEGRSRSGAPAYGRNTRRRHRDVSPGERGRPRDLSRDGARSHRSRSSSMDKSRIARGRRSMTPETVREHYSRQPRRGNTSPDHTRSSNRSNGGRSEDYARAPPRQRSLSPYSKRLALTQAMNLGR